jgi:WD40 repeat protein
MPETKPAPAKPLPTDRQLGVIRFGRCGKWLLGGGLDGSIRRWDIAGDAPVERPRLTGHDGWVQALAVHADGRRVFSADTWGGLRAWPYAEAEPKPLWSVAEAHDGFVRQLAISPDGRMLASCGRDARVRLWEADTGKTADDLPHPEDVFSVAFHPDGKSLATGDLRGVIRHWDLTTRKISRELDARLLYLLDRMQDVGGVRSLAFDGAGERLLATGTAPKTGGFVEGIPVLRVFNWAKGTATHTLQGAAPNEGFAHDAHWLADGTVLAATSGQPGQGKLLAWRPGDEKPFFTSTTVVNCHSLAIHPDGKRLAVLGTNANSSGNARVTGANKEYPGNHALLHFLAVPAAPA